MTYTFNLISEPWIPSVLIGGEQREMGIRDVLEQAPEIREIVDASPLATVAIHRLLLAVLHRVFGPAEVDAWITMWTQRRWDAKALDDYLSRWSERFDLFHTARPFYGTAEISAGPTAAAYKLALELGSSNADLFTHMEADAPFTFTPAQAARHLLAIQCFDVGGLKSYEEGRLVDKYVEAAPLNRCAVAVIKGENLFQTLMLNLHRYNAKQELPFAFIEQEDLPAWERDEPARVEVRGPRGPIDLLTWQARRVRLVPQTDEIGNIVVSQAVVMKGAQFPKGFQLRQVETMVAFRQNLKSAEGQDPWPPIGFREERAVWRDSLALFQLSDQERRPRTLTWLAELAERGVLDYGVKLPGDIYGLSGDQAKINLWRHERLPLPLIYLRDQELLARVQEALGIAEWVAGSLDSGRSGGKQAGAVEIVAKALLTPGSEEDGPQSADPRAVRGLADSMAVLRRYWSQLDVPFNRFLVAQAQDVYIDEFGERVAGRAALEEWWVIVSSAGRRAFGEATDNLDGSGRSLRALTKGERRLNSSLRYIERTHEFGKEETHERAVPA